MKTVIRIITFIALVCVAAFGAYALYQNGDIARFFPDNTAGKDTITQNEENPNKNVSPQKDEKHPNTFVAPNVGNPAEIFIHENGFEYGKTSFKMQGVNETVSSDKNRVKQVSFRLTKDKIPLYATGPADAKAFSEHQLTKNGAKYYFAGAAWRQNIHPYLHDISKWIRDNSTDVIVVVTFEYSKETDTAAEYVTLRAFSREDLGETLSVNTTFHQYADGQALDYKTRNYATAYTKDNK